MPETFEQRERRWAIWRHNGRFGSVAMAMVSMRSIIFDDNLCTAETKAQADKILGELYKLNELLKTRADHV